MTLYISIYHVGCIADYFKGDECDDDSKRVSSKEIQAYKCVLNSKASEEAMVVGINCLLYMYSVL